MKNSKLFFYVLQTFQSNLHSRIFNFISILSNIVTKSIVDLISLSPLLFCLLFSFLLCSQVDFNMDQIVLTTMVVMRESWLFFFTMKMVRKSTQKHAKFYFYPFHSFHSFHPFHSFHSFHPFHFFHSFHPFHSFHVCFVDCFFALLLIPISFSLNRYYIVLIMSVY